MVLLFAPSFTSRLFAQERSLIIFGKAVPSIPDPEQGAQVIVEDFQAGLAAQTYRVLPSWLQPIFGLHISEHQYTQDGVPAGRRISFYPLTSVGKIDREDRLAYFDFDDRGYLERYRVFKHPQHWFNPQKIAPKTDGTPDETFFFELLAPFFESSPLPESAISPPRKMKAPIGLLSPMVIRPIFDIQRLDATSVQMAMHIARTYNAQGSLQQIALTLNELPISSEGELIAHAVQSQLTTLPDIIEGMQISRILETAKPCRLLLSELKRREGGALASD